MGASWPGTGEHLEAEQAHVEVPGALGVSGGDPLVLDENDLRAGFGGRLTGNVDCHALSLRCYFTWGATSSMKRRMEARTWASVNPPSANRPATSVR